MTGWVATSWLEGSIEVPFPYVAGIVGIVVLAILLYYVRRIS